MTQTPAPLMPAQWEAALATFRRTQADFYRERVAYYGLSESKRAEGWPEQMKAAQQAQSKAACALRALNVTPLLALEAQATDPELKDLITLHKPLAPAYTDARQQQLQEQHEAHKRLFPVAWLPVRSASGRANSKAVQMQQLKRLKDLEKRS